jgi:hypothetical protein
MRKSVTTLLATLAVGFGLTATTGVALADGNNNGGIGGVGGNHNNDGGLLGGVIQTNGGTCNGVTVISSCKSRTNNNYGDNVGYSGGYGYYSTLYNRSHYAVDVCDYRNRLGHNWGARNTGWHHSRDEGSCSGTTFVTQPVIWDVTQEPGETKLSNPGNQVALPRSPVIDTGDGSTVGK